MTTTRTRTKLPAITATARRAAAVAAFLAADEASKVASSARSDARDLVDRVCPNDGRIETEAGVVNVTTQTATKVDIDRAMTSLPPAVILACCSALDAERLAAYRDLGTITAEQYDEIVSTSTSRRVARGK